MTLDFYEFVDHALRKANALSQWQPSPEKLPGKGPCKIRCVFPISTLDGRRRLV
jgi:hypothetical protein